MFHSILVWYGVLSKHESLNCYLWNIMTEQLRQVTQIDWIEAAATCYLVSI